MTLSYEQLDYYTLVKMSPLMDEKLAPELLRLFDDLLEHTNKKVIIDFSETDDIDSSGIGALVYLFKRLHRRSLSLELVGLQRQPLRKIRFLHLDYVIKIRHKN